MQAQIVQWRVKPGDTVQAGDVRATHAARVTELFYAAGESVAEGDLLLNQELLVQAAHGLEADSFMEYGALAVAAQRSRRY